MPDDRQRGFEDDITVAPDGRPAEEQPRWRQDFPIDWPKDHHTARRDFTKFLVLTSGAFVCGQAWIAVQSVVRRGKSPPPRRQIASLRDLAVGSAAMFTYPGDGDPCLLLRLGEHDLVAFSQKCTHLSCAVVPELDKGVLHCPCHEGYFDARTGANIAGPPPRPLPEIELEIAGDEVFAIGIRERTS